MFGLATGLYRTYFSPANLSILIIGPDCAGKTALLERIKVTQFSTARQLRTLAAAHGGTVPLPRSRISTSGRMDGDGGGAGEMHRRHNSAPIVMDAKSGDSGSGSRGGSGAASTAPPQTKEDTIEQGSNANIGKSPNSADGPRTTAAATATATATAQSSSARRRRFLVCPAPRMYSREAMTEGDDDEEEERFDEVVLSDDGNGDASDAYDADEDPDSDLKSLLGDVEDVAAPTTGSTHQDVDDYNDDDEHGHGQQQQQQQEEEEEEVEHDVKKSARMLPLHLIRPTIGQNLAKMDACGCRINIFDLGGMIKMRPLWDRYYSEVDAVIFVVDARTVGGAGGGGGISRLEETVEAFDTVRDQDVLDGVPLMVFANKVDRGEGGRLVSDDDDRYQQQRQQQRQQEEDGGDSNDAAAAANNDRFHPSKLDLDVLSNALNLYGHPTKSLDNDMIVMTAGSARTGEGVRAAFEWLVLKARNVQREMEVIDRKMTM